MKSKNTTRHASFPNHLMGAGQHLLWALGAALLSIAPMSAQVHLPPALGSAADVPSRSGNGASSGPLFSADGESLLYFSHAPDLASLPTSRRWLESLKIKIDCI
jgi:hypothetical protein